MPRLHSAGILLFRRSGNQTEVLLVRPGGPYWRNRNIGAWMIPKGAVEPGESAAEAALREFAEETGTRLDRTPFPLASVRQAGGKYVEAFALEGDLDATAVSSVMFELEWPPRSGKLERFPEVVEARWMDIRKAREMMLESQRPLLDALEQKLIDRRLD